MNENAPGAGVNGEARGIDPDAYRQPAGASPVDGPAPEPSTQPIPDGFVAGLLARLASAGIKDKDEVARFQREYRVELEELFGWLELSDALAEYGITFGGGAPMPPWMRIAGSAGGAGVLLLMRRPELLARYRSAMKRGGGDGESSSAVAGGDAGGAGGAGSDSAGA